MAQQTKKVDWDNPSNYKNCSKKFYDIHVCMPPKNTIVINKLEQADVVKQLGGRTYFTVDDIKKLQSNNPQMITTLQQLVGQGRAYAVTDATPFVLCGTVGEMWTIKPDKLASTYTFLQDGQPLQINQQTLEQRMKNGVLDWTLIRVSRQETQVQNMACFVHSAQKGQIQTSCGAVRNINGVGVSHGKGDFIVCAKLPNGLPNLADRWVVNGDIFATTYNNQGWTDCLNNNQFKSMTTEMLPKLISDDLKKLNLTFDDCINIVCFKHSRFYEELLGLSVMLSNPSRPLNEYNKKNTFKNECKEKAFKSKDSLKTKDSNSHYSNNNDDFDHSITFKDIIDTLFYNLNSNDSTIIKKCYGAFRRIAEDIICYGLFLRPLLVLNDGEYTTRMLGKLEHNILSCKSADFRVKCLNENTLTMNKNFVSFSFSSEYTNFIIVDFSKDCIGIRRFNDSTIDYGLVPKLPSKVVGVSYCSIPVINLYESVLSKMSSSLLPFELLDSCVSSNIVNRDSFSDLYETTMSFIKYGLDWAFTPFGGQVNEDDLSTKKGTGIQRNDDCIKFRYRFFTDGISSSGNTAVSSNNSCTLFVKVNLDYSVNVKAKYNNKVFEKTYKIGLATNTMSVGALIFIDICKLFRVHPAKTLYSKKKTWDSIFTDINSKLSNYGYSIRYISMDSNNDKVLVRFAIENSSGNVLGERTFVTDYNYANFNYKSSSSIRTRTIVDSMNDKHMLFGEMLITNYISYTGDKYSDKDIYISNAPFVTAENLHDALVNLLSNKNKYGMN